MTKQRRRRVYETELMTYAQCVLFQQFIDDKIGVDYEVNEMDDDEHYILVLDLEEDEEYELLRNYENNMEPKTYSIGKGITEFLNERKST